VTKAVHIVVVTSLSTEKFLAALRCFIACRGKPRNICTEYGTKFQDAAYVHHALHKMLQSTSDMAKLEKVLAIEEFECKFIRPHGSHF